MTSKAVPERRERASSVGAGDDGPAGASHPPDLFTASDVARFCQVDLKTIHNWADKGEIPHFRTPGRHLRFRRLDVFDFLRKYGYAIPESFRQSKPRLVLVEGDAATMATMKRTLSKRFELTSFQDPLDALVSVVALQPDALVIDVDMPGLDVLKVVARLRSLTATSHIRSFVFTHRSDVRQQAMDAGALDVVSKDDIARLREVLEQRMGVEY